MRVSNCEKSLKMDRGERLSISLFPIELGVIEPQRHKVLVLVGKIGGSSFSCVYQPGK